MRMKKNIVGCVAIFSIMLVLTPKASANFAYNWGGSAGFFYTNNPTVGFLQGGGTALAQFIFSFDSTIDAAVNNPANNFLSGDDILIDTFDLVFNPTPPPASTGSDFGDFSDSFNNPTNAAVGFIYGRIFETNAGGITLGTLYYDGPLNTASNVVGSPPPPPLGYELNRDLINGDVLSLMVVPEPSSLAFIVLGVGAFAYRRFRRR